MLLNEALMPLYDKPRDERLLELTIAAVQQANSMVKELEENSRYIGSHFDFPKSISYDERSLPQFDRQNITNYGSPFGPERGQFTRVAYDEVPALQKMIEYVLANEKLTDRITGWETANDTDRSFARIGVAVFALNVLDRARHVYGADPTDGDLTALYMEREPVFFLDELPVEIVVPLVLTKFDVASRENLAEGLHLERLSDEDQLARVRGTFSHGPVSQFVAEGATHALVWSGYEVGPHFGWSTNRLDFYPNETIDTALASLRLVIEQPTGYAQILLRPIGWAHRWAGPLGSLMPAIAVHRYPRILDDGGWRRDISTVSRDWLPVVGSAYERLTSASSEVRLAARRLNSALLRDREDDALLDACISLEAVLGEHTEILHKLALRVAALSTISPLPMPIAAPDVFRAVKRVYAYRSKLIHGSADATKAAMFRGADGSDWKTLDLAVLLVRMVILVLLDHRAFVRSEAIEESLLATPLTVTQVEDALAPDTREQRFSTD